MCRSLAPGWQWRHHPTMNDAIAALVRRHDPDRFLTALFARPDRRNALLALYAFNHELARAREVASTPPLALIRLQWWREVVEGEMKRHEVATPLSAAIGAGLLVPDDLLSVIEARETEVYGDFETVSDWQAWLLMGAGGLAVAAARGGSAGGGGVRRQRRGADERNAGGARVVPAAARCPAPAWLVGRGVHR
jgi:phytoene synthase